MAIGIGHWLNTNSDRAVSRQGWSSRPTGDQETGTESPNLHLTPPLSH